MLAAWMIGPVSLRAQNDPPLSGQAPSSSTPQTFEKREELIDDRSGLRAALKQRGVDLDVEYTNYYQGILSGDTRRGHDDDWGRIRFTVDVDFAKLAHLDGLSFHISAVNQSGGNIGNNLGTYNNPNNMASTQSTRLDTYWLQQKFFNNVLVVRLGQLSQVDDYALQEYASSFVMNALGFNFSNLFANVVATADPASKPGFELQLRPPGGFYLKSMIQAGDPDPYGDHDHHGLGFSLDGHGVLATEAGFRPQAAPNAEQDTVDADGKDEKPDDVPLSGIKTMFEGGLPAVYKIGIYNSFADYQDARNADKIHGNYAVYAMINQGLFRQGHEGEALSRGLDGFAGFDYSPDNVSLAYLQAVGGLRYTGLFPKSAKDTFALGVVCTEFSRRFNTPASTLLNGQYTTETALELNYEYRITRWLSVQPVGQYYVNPGGNGRHPNAVILGFGSKVVF